MQYAGLATVTRGNPLDETGINLESFSCRYYPQFKDKLNNYQGQARAWAMPDKLNREVTVTGEVISGGTGIMAMKFLTAYVFTNAVTSFEATNGGGNAGGFYVDEATVSSQRDGWLTVNVRASADPLIA